MHDDDGKLSVSSQFDNMSVCTRRAADTQPPHSEGPVHVADAVDGSAGGRNNFLCCDNGDRPGRSHSQPPPSTRSSLTLNVAAVPSHTVAEAGPMCTHGTGGIRPPR